MLLLAWPVSLFPSDDSFMLHVSTTPSWSGWFVHVTLLPERVPENFRTPPQDQRSEPERAPWLSEIETVV